MLGEILGGLAYLFVPKEYIDACNIILGGVGNLIVIYFIIYIYDYNMWNSFQFNKISFNLNIKSIFLALGTISISYFISYRCMQS